MLDTSAQGNNASLANGASVTKVAGSCGVCAQLLGGNIVIQGKGFRGVPQQEITIAFMIRLLDTKGTLKFFETIGSHSTHTLRKSIFHYPILLAVIIYPKAHCGLKLNKSIFFFSIQTNFYLYRPKHFLLFIFSPSSISFGERRWEVTLVSSKYFRKYSVRCSDGSTSSGGGNMESRVSHVYSSIWKGSDIYRWSAVEGRNYG